jgi:hypothetical protein
VQAPLARRHTKVRFAVAALFTGVQTYLLL